jgi:virginiamycin A acetyltransferase
MGAANHLMTGASTFPFPMFGDGWMPAMDLLADRPRGGDTVVGNDVWIGSEALVMAGARIGDGAIVAARSVVTGDVPAYGVVGGNPARLVRRRFADAEVERLLRIAWWNWPIEVVTTHIRTIMSGDIDSLDAIDRERGIAARPRNAVPAETIRHQRQGGGTA